MLIRTIAVLAIGAALGRKFLPPRPMTLAERCARLPSDTKSMFVIKGGVTPDALSKMGYARR